MIKFQDFHLKNQHDFYKCLQYNGYQLEKPGGLTHNALIIRKKNDYSQLTVGKE